MMLNISMIVMLILYNFHTSYAPAIQTLIIFVLTPLSVNHISDTVKVQYDYLFGMTAGDEIELISGKLKNKY